MELKAHDMLDAVVHGPVPPVGAYGGGVNLEWNLYGGPERQTVIEGDRRRAEFASAVDAGLAAVDWAWHLFPRPYDWELQGV